MAQFCYEQRLICRKICDLHSRFEDRFDGCPQSCDSRELRCVTTACYRWTEPDFLIAERFGRLSMRAVTVDAAVHDECERPRQSHAAFFQLHGDTGPEGDWT